MSATLDKTVRQSLRTLVKGVVGMPVVAGWENVEFKPTAEQHWYQEARLAPLPRTLADMGGAVNHVRADYVYEVHIGAPRQTGPEYLEAYAGLLLSAMKAGTQFVVEGQTARISSAARSSIMYPEERLHHAVIACTFVIVLLALNT